LVCASHSSGNTAETREGNEKPLGNIPALKTFSLCGILAGGGSDVVGWRFGYSVGGRIIHITLKKGVREIRQDVTREMTVLGTILLIILILILIGSLPTWPYSAGWGYYPSSGLGLILIIVLILVLVGRI
jgi:hypothetical protein